MSPVEAPPEPTPQSEITGTEPDMVVFRHEMKEILPRRTGPGEANLKIDELTVADARMWYKSNDKKVGISELMQDFPMYVEDIEIMQNPNRRIFSQIIANIIQKRH